MKRALIILLVLVGLSLYQSVYALPGLKLGLDGNLALPQGDWSDLAGTGYGATAFAMITLLPVVNLSAHAGYLKFGEKTIQTPAGTETIYNFSAIPLLAGVRIYVLPLPRLYVGGQAGFHYLKLKVKLKPTGSEAEESENKFSVAPTVGVEFGPLEASAFYMLISDANYAGLRVGIRF